MVSEVSIFKDRNVPSLKHVISSKSGKNWAHERSNKSRNVENIEMCLLKVQIFVFQCDIWHIRTLDIYKVDRIVDLAQ